jgi:hypothetical protein
MNISEKPQIERFGAFAFDSESNIWTFQYNNLAF